MEGEGEAGGPWEEGEAAEGCPLAARCRAATSLCRVEERQPYGRCLVAEEAIPEGAVVLQDAAVVAGPKLTAEPLCLSCYRPLPALRRCSRCGWTVCSQRCESAQPHLTECETLARWPLQLARFSAAAPPYEALLPLRCLLLPRRGGARRLLAALAAHDTQRAATPAWALEQKNVVEFIREKFAVEESEATIHRVTGVLDINCHEIAGVAPATEGGAPVPYYIRGVFPLAAMMSHCCTPNTQHTTRGADCLTLTASRPIAKGEQITSTYTHLLWGTQERRKHLRQSKLFDCCCARCADPTELGTHMSTLLCTQCGGNLLCSNPLSSDDLADFICVACGFEMPGEHVAALTARLSSLVAEAGDGDTAALRAALHAMTPLLHPQHHLALHAKSRLAQEYGRTDGLQLHTLPAAALQHKVECCRAVLRPLSLLLPGVSRLRGVVLFELQAALVQQLRAAREGGAVSAARELAELRQVAATQRETLRCLAHDLPDSFEGIAARVTQTSLHSVLQRVSHLEELTAPQGSPLTAPGGTPLRAPEGTPLRAPEGTPLRSHSTGEPPQQDVNPVPTTSARGEPPLADRDLSLQQLLSCLEA